MYTKDLKLAIRAVKSAEKTFRKYFGISTHVQTKNGNYRNLVSIADKKIEKDIKKLLARSTPSYGFIGEETSTVNGHAEYVWALDPIDGTTNYIHGVPECAISLALLKKNKPILGVVYAPYWNRMYLASKGHGSFMNGKKIKVSGVTDLKKSFGSLGWAKNLNFAKKTFPALLPKVLTLRVAGCASLALCQIAEGVFDFFLGRTLNIWDYAAGQIIIEEAGGEFKIDKKNSLQIAGNNIIINRLAKLL